MPRKREGFTTEDARRLCRAFMKDTPCNIIGNYTVTAKILNSLCVFKRRYKSQSGYVITEGCYRGIRFTFSVYHTPNCWGEGEEGLTFCDYINGSSTKYLSEIVVVHLFTIK